MNMKLNDSYNFCFKGNKESLMIDYNMLASVEQVLAYFLPEAPTEMLMNLDEVGRQFCLMLLMVSFLALKLSVITLK